MKKFKQYTVWGLMSLCVLVYADPRAQEELETLNTKLILAAKEGSISKLNNLIDAGADVNANNGSPLMKATTYNHTEAAVLLLERGADINATNQYGETALLRATLWIENRYDDIAALLIEKNADVNARNQNGETALLRATSSGHLKIVKLLVQYGADINAQNQIGKTAPILAAEYKHKEILRYLLAH